MFDHPYLAMYRRLHEEFDLKIQLNLFYRMENFDLSQMSEDYRDEWRENADWLKLSFHSDRENVNPYKHSKYEEVFADCRRVNEQILRFASDKSLANTTTVHYCQTTEEGLRALADNGIRGLLGLFGDDERPSTSYAIDFATAEEIRKGNSVTLGGITFASLDIVLNCFSEEQILLTLQKMTNREDLRVMIHEQYFYSDYKRYQPEFEAKLRATFSFLKSKGYFSVFFENMI